MAETLGSLCDKLTVVKLKQWHTRHIQRRQCLSLQESALQREINEFIVDALEGRIPKERLQFEANKVYRKKGNMVAAVQGELGEVFSRLAEVNCALWHEQEKVYAFEKVADREKCSVVKKLALLNLERNRCMEAIDKNFLRCVRRKKRTGKRRCT